MQVSKNQANQDTHQVGILDIIIRLRRVVRLCVYIYLDVFPAAQDKSSCGLGIILSQEGLPLSSSDLDSLRQLCH